MQKPGHLDALNDDARAAWDERVARCFADLGEHRFLRPHPSPATPHDTIVDWTGFPVRVAACLTRRRAEPLLDWRGQQGGEGWRGLQEEYLEWRAVRGPRRELRRVELTTELAAYWRVMAAHDPATLLETVAELAGHARVSPKTVYGDVDPFGTSVTPARRERAFAAAMLGTGASSPYNTGVKAICCMINDSNTLEALVSLMGIAACARRTASPHVNWRCLTAAEAIPRLESAAVAGRASDPLIVERLGRLVFEGRAIAFTDPPGVVIQGVEHARLRTPSGDTVPLEWFRFSRGRAPHFQRLVFEVPPGEGFAVSDLVDVATDRTIEFGAQIAELVQVVLPLRVGPAGAVAFEPCETVEACAATNTPAACDDVMRHDRAFARAHGR